MNEIILIEESDDGTGHPYWHTSGHQHADAWSVIGNSVGYHIEDYNGYDFTLEAAKEEAASLALVIAKLEELQRDA